MSRIRDRLKGLSWQQKIVEGVCLLIALAGVATSIRMNFVGRSLWFDEAALAFSFSQRGLVDLTATKLELVQAAPVGWLYALKIFTLIFGNTDFLLRVPSILAYIGILIVLYLISYKVFDFYYPMAPLAFGASFPLILQYSNIFKPYIYDALFSLVVLWIFYQYLQGNMKPVAVGICLAVILWFSNTSCFVEGGFVLGVGLVALLDRNWRRMVDLIKICLFMGGSFLINYIYWLRKTDEGMYGFWAAWKFPLIPTSIQDLRDLKLMIETLFEPFYRLEWIFMILFAAAFFYALWKKQALLLGIYGTALVTAFASFIGMYPVNRRLWLFYYPLVIITVFVCLDFLIDRGDKRRISAGIMGIILMGMCILNAGIRYYWNPENVYWPRYEAKAEYYFLRERVREDEKIYVSSATRPMFCYYNNYNFETLEGTDISCRIGELPLGDAFDCQDDLDYILGAKKCYVFMGDTWDDMEAASQLFKQTRERGYFQMVYNEYETPCWYYCEDIRDSKIAVSYEILSVEQGEKEDRYAVRIRNEGEAYINHKFETVTLSAPEGTCVELPEDMAPGTFVDVILSVSAGQAATYEMKNEYGIYCLNGDITLGL